MEPAKTEYDYLRDFYLYLAVFDPFTSTFKFLYGPEREKLMMIIKALQKELQMTMPKVQDREASHGR